MMRPLLASLFVLACAVAPAQRAASITSLRFVPVADERLLPLDSDLVLANGATASVSKLRFYVSHVALHAAGRVVWNDGDRCHLVDVSDSAQMIIALPTPAEIVADSVSFLLGVDSLTNVSGALGGDLDPTKGMYWAWNSGYINFKLEGSSTACTARDHQFEFHLGGYLPPDRSVQEVSVGVTGGPVAVIAFDIPGFLNTLDLQKEYRVTSPGHAAVRLSMSAANSFKQYAGK